VERVSPLPGGAPPKTPFLKLIGFGYLEGQASQIVYHFTILIMNNNFSATQTPKLVIGMPVYNGENHISETIKSILGQSFKDFKLFISDNASTDSTESICRSFASQDSRIVYFRQPKNLGMAPNFNNVFQPGDSPYFKWAAHDDILKPTYLERCIQLLETDPSLAMVHSPTLRIDDSGRELGLYKDIGLDGDRISDRFWKVLWTVNIYEIYGVMRSQYVAKTKLAGSYFGSERNILAEVLVQGKIEYLDEALFARRDHDASLTAMHLESKAGQDFARRQEVHATGVKMSGLQTSAIRFKEYFNSIQRFPMSFSDRVRCHLALLDWGIKRGVESVSGSGERHREKIYAQQA
jgi:glycosyltransferase involved in cell wall biosynthesis